MRLANGEVLLRWPLAQHIITAGWTYNDGRGCRCERMIAAEYGLRILDAQPKG